MRKQTLFGWASVATAAIAVGLAPIASATENWAAHSVAQQAVVKLKSSTGGTVQGLHGAAIDAYLSTRDPNSPKTAHQPQAVATVRMTFPVGSKANPIGTCPMWPTTKPWDLKRICGGGAGSLTNAGIGQGWALVSGFGTSPLARMTSASAGTVAPSGAGNYSDAPADCATPSDPATDPQYSRSFQTLISFTNWKLGPACLATGSVPGTPAGFVWVHVYVYAGAGNGTYKAGVNGNKPYDRTDPLHKRAPKVTDSRAVIFANDNGIAALSFSGTIKTNANKSVTLAVDLPAFNSAGLKGFLPLDTDLVDFRLLIRNTRYVTVGSCPSSRKLNIATAITYSQFPSDYAAGNLTKYPNRTVNTSIPCKV